MSRTVKIVRNIAISIAAVVVLLIIVALIVVQTGWFRNYVRQEIIAATEKGTGGTVDIGAFDFSPWQFRATVTNFVIHGNEPAGAAPFVRVGNVVVYIRLFTSFKHLLDITSLGIEQPQVNVMVLPNGNTNIPTPKEKSTSNESTLKQVVDLAVGRFEISKGLLAFESLKQPLNVRGNNLRVELLYNTLLNGYQGQLSLEPLYVAAGRNTPVNFKVTVPVNLQEDRIDIRNASIASPLSTISLNGSISNMQNPQVSSNVGGHIAMRDVADLANVPVALNARGVPSTLDLNVNATASGDTIRVTGLNAALGRSNIEASGTLEDPKGNGTLQFKSELALGELGRLLKVSARPEGTVALNGDAKLAAGGNYSVTGNIRARNVSLQQGTEHIRDINLDSALHVDPHNVDLSGLRLIALGGEFDGNVALQDFEKFKVNGDLKHLDIQTAMRTLGERLPYDGSISGSLDAQGDTKAPGTKSLIANARLAITPGKRGIPVSGRLNANYSGTADDVTVQDSYLALPHTRVDLSGSLRRSLNVSARTSNLNDLLAATTVKSPPPVMLNNGGQASFNGTVTGGLSSPRIAGHLSVNRFSLEDRPFDSLGLDVAASSSGAAIRNGQLTRGSMQAQLAASVGLRNWKPLPREPLSATMAMRDADLGDLVAMAGEPSAGYSGALSASANVSGTVGNPQGSANLQVSDGTLDNQPFDQARIQVSLSDQLVMVPVAYIQSGAGRLDLNAQFRHPRDSFTQGSLSAHVQSNQVDLSKIRVVQNQKPNTSGTLQINVDASGNLSHTMVAGKQTSQFALTSVNADVSAKGIRLEGQNYGDLSATARTNAQAVAYNLTSDFAGSNIRVNGNTQLVHDYPTTADANIGNLPMERVLVLAGRSDLPARGNLSATAHVNGTLNNPQGTVDLSLVRAVIYQEPVDQARLRMTYLAQSIDVPQFEVVSGPARIDLTAHYDHPAGNLRQGNARFNIASSRIDLSRIKNIQSLRPGLGGTLQINARGAGTVRQGSPPILFSDLNANIAANGISAQGKNFGDLTLTANTTSGDQLNFALDSNLADASIHGRGNARLTGNYPVNAQVTFSNVLYTHIQNLLGSNGGQPPSFEAATDGQVTLNGPVLNTNELTGNFQLTRLNISTLPRPGAGKPIAINSQGPIVVALDRGTVRIETAHVTGPDTNIEATGTASIPAKTMNLTLNANANLNILPNFDPDIYSSGTVALNAVARGTFSQPLINGQLRLQNASLNYASVPNGISNANGLIAFNGNTAQIQTLTAESGGGRINVSGFAGYGPVVRFGVRAQATRVRVRVQEGVSIVVGADVQLTGTENNSVISGTATIDQVTYTPRTDIGSLLTRAAPPVQSPTAPSPLLDNMKLDIRVRTMPGMLVQASLAENLQADADLRVRGTASTPGITGRVTISQGQLVFFGATYTVNTGSINFYNPFRIDPVLDVSLETQAQGVDVVLRVTGPVDNMNLSYTSNPPLQFQEIVALLATGKAPTSDPTLLANQPNQPQQSFQQMGESAILGQAIANPVSSRLERVFGVTQLKIDPSFQSGTSTPTARLTLQQRITSNLTFTYTSALNDPNGEIIKVEWAFDPRWSAVATRDQNGIFSINFFYRRQFR